MFFSIASVAWAEIEKSSARQIKSQRSVRGWGIRLDGIIGSGVGGRRCWSTWELRSETGFSLSVKRRDLLPRRGKRGRRKSAFIRVHCLVSAKKERYRSARESVSRSPWVRLVRVGVRLYRTRCALGRARSCWSTHHSHRGRADRRRPPDHPWEDERRGRRAGGRRDFRPDPSGPPSKRSSLSLAFTGVSPLPAKAARRPGERACGCGWVLLLLG